jgi:hypothetical protein
VCFAWDRQAAEYAAFRRAAPSGMRACTLTDKAQDSSPRPGRRADPPGMGACTLTDKAQDSSPRFVRGAKPAWTDACKGPSSKWPASPITVWRRIYVSRSEMAQGGTDGPYDPAWSGPGGSVPGAFDDAFYEVVDTPISPSDGNAYYPNIGGANGPGCSSGSPISIVAYAHGNTPYPSNPHPNSSAQLLGADGVDGRNAGADSDGNGVPETGNPASLVAWGEACEADHSAVGVGDLNRLTRSYLPPPAPQGAESQPGLATA